MSKVSKKTKTNHKTGKVISIKTASQTPEHIRIRMRYKNGCVLALDKALDRAHTHELLFGHPTDKKVTAIASAMRNARFVGKKGNVLKGEALRRFKNKALYNQVKDSSKAA